MKFFLKGLQKFGRCWKDIATLIPTRTVVQIRTHAQKYFQKIEKLQRAECIRKDLPQVKATRRRSNSLKPEDLPTMFDRGFKLTTTTSPTMSHSDLMLPQLPPHFFTNVVAPDIEQLLADEADGGWGGTDGDNWFPPRFRLQ